VVLPVVMLVLTTVIDYLDRHGTAFSFLTALVLALLTGGYVVLTVRLAASQEQATRASTEPVVIARTAITEEGLRVTAGTRALRSLLAFASTPARTASRPYASVLPT
jgi:hypothetical protein